MALVTAPVRTLRIPGLNAWRSGKLKLFRDLAALASGQVAGRAVGFLAFAYLARVLEPAGYGAVEYVVGLSVFFGYVVEGGLGPVGVRRAIKDPASLPSLAFQVPIARLLIAIPGIPVMALFASVAMKGGAPSGLIWLFALSLLTTPWMQDWLLQATDRMAQAALAQVIRAVSFAVMVWILVHGQHDLLKVGWSEIVSVTAMTVFVAWIQHTRIAPFRLHGSFKGLGGLLREGAGLGATNLVWATSQSAPLLLAGVMLGQAEVAFFGAAARILQALLTFSNLYHFNLYPAVARAASGDRGALGRLMRCSFRVCAWGGVGLALGLTLFATSIAGIAFGPKMGATAPVLEVLAWVVPITLCSGHARWSLIAAGAQIRVLWSQAAGLAAVLIAAPLLGHAYGIVGIAYATALSAIAVWVTAHAFGARQGLEPPPLGLAARPALLAAAILAAVSALGGAQPLAPLAGLLLFAAAAPLLDRKLLSDLAQLGRAKLATAGGDKPGADP